MACTLSGLWWPVFLLPPPLGAQPADPCPVTRPLSCPRETQCNGWRGPNPRLSRPQGNSIWCPGTRGREPSVTLFLHCNPNFASRGLSFPI